MRAGIVSISHVQSQRWIPLNASTNLGKVERYADELKLAQQHFKNANARLNRAKASHKAALALSQRLLDEHKVVPVG